MSSSIENRIVKMQFDNGQFEKEASNSLKTLDKLKEALHFDGIENGIDKISSKFSNMGIVAVTALQNITNKAIDTGEKLVKSLSVDNITAGWKKYEQETASVQTLINATGKSQEEIYKYLDKLMWYSDETSYGFTDMTQALATMTSSGGDIDKLIPMIEGVANATAYAGKGAAEFSRVMQYSINQAYSLGYLQVQDWKTIEGATVNSKALIQELIKAGEELKTIKKGEVTLENFRNTLRDKWLTKEVMEKGFGTFGKVTEEIYAGVESGKFDTYADGLKEIGNKYGEVALKAAKSAQEAKTFQEAIDATKDAVSSKWMTTFETIFGTYEEATEFWTWLTNDIFYELFAASGDARNELLAEWKDLGGRDEFVSAFHNIGDAVMKLKEVITEAFHEIFPPMTAKKLLELTKNINEFTKKLIISDDSADRLKDILSGIFSIAKAGIEVFKIMVRVISAIISALKEATGGTISGAVAYFVKLTGELLTKVQYLSNNLERFAFYVVLKVADVFGKLKDVVETLKQKFIEIAWVIALKVAAAFDKIRSIKISDIFSKISESVFKAYSALQAFGDKISDVFQKIFGKIKGFGIKIQEFWDSISGKDILKGGGITAIVSIVAGAVLKIKELFSNIGEIASSVSETTSSILDGIKTISSDISSVLGTVKDALQSWQKDLKADILKKIAESVLMIAGSVFLLSKVNTDNLVKSMTAITVLLGEVVGILMLIDKLGSYKKIDATQKKFRLFGNASDSFLKITASLLLLAGALKMVSDIPTDKMGMAMIALSGLIWEVFGVTKLLSKIGDKTFAKTAAGIIVFSLSLIAMAEAMRILSKLTWKELIAGLTGLGSAMFMTVVAVNRIDANGELLKAAAGMLLFAIAIKALVGIIKDLGNNVDQYAQLAVGMGMVEVILLGLVFALFLLKKAMDGFNAGDLIKIGASMIIFAVSLKVIVSAIKDLGSMDVNQIANGVLGIVAVLTAILTMTALMDKFINVESLIKFSAALILMGIALTAISIPIKILGSMPVESIVNGLLAIIVALMAFIVAGYAAEPVILIIIGLAAACLMFAASIVVFGAGLNLIVLAIKGFIGAIALALDVVKKAASTIVDVISILINGIIEIVASAIEILLSSIAGIGTAFINGVTSIVNAINSLLQALIGVLKTLVSGVLDIVKMIFYTIIDCVKKLSELDWETCSEGMLVLVAAIGVFAASVAVMSLLTPVLIALGGALVVFGSGLMVTVTAINMAINTIIAIIKVIPLAKKIIEDTIDAIETKIEEMKTSVDNAVAWFKTKWEEIKTAVSDAFEWAWSAGKNLMEGLWNGIKDGADFVLDGITGLGKSIKDGFCDMMGIKSPSKVFKEYGKYIDEGLVKGITENTSGVEKAVDSLGYSVTSSFSNADSTMYSLGSSMSDAFNRGLNKYTTSSISPVVDIDSKNLNFIPNMFTDSIKGSIDNIGKIDATQTINEHVSFDILTVQGVNNEGEFVASADYAVDELLTNMLRREARL